MSQCAQCGAEIEESAKFCPSCGAWQQASDTAQPLQVPSQEPNYQQATYQQPSYQQATYYQQPNETAPVNDSGSIGWAILGFFIPIVGLVLFIVWRNEKPRCSKMSGMGALVSVILSVVMGILSSIVSVLLLASI